jgi:3-hydroxyisobutyrate dehydrogenase
MLQDDPPVRSAVDIFVKDMGLVVSAAQRLGQRTDLAGAARQVYESASEQGLGRQDDSSVIRLYGVRPEGPGAG